MTMAVEIDPDGRGPIEIPFPFRIDQIGPLSPCDNERLLLFPFLHLSKGMPEVLAIPVNQLSRGGYSCHGVGGAEARMVCRGTDYTRERLL